MDSAKKEIRIMGNPAGSGIAYVEDDFDKAATVLKTAGYSIATLKNVCAARIDQGKEAEISGQGGWTSEAFLFVPDKGHFVTKHSPVLNNPTVATRAHTQGREYFLTNDQLDEAIQEAVQVNETRVPADRLADNEVTAFLLGDIAGAYGALLRSAGISQMRIRLVRTADKPFTRQLGFRSIKNESQIGGGWGLNHGYRLCGVLPR